MRRNPRSNNSLAVDLTATQHGSRQVAVIRF
jgi:hypothetical protein